MSQKTDPPLVPWSRWLPTPGFGRAAFLILASLLLALKVLAILHFRADSDEAQHAHVVWGWANGQLQYRDLFDNHMPLFQMALAPFFKLLGERADILVPLRFAMLPLYLICLWCVFRVAEELFPGRVAPWICLCAGALPRFFFTSTEFRTDDLWAAFWLMSLLTAVKGRFTMPRAFGFGMLLGLAFAVSLKTVILVVAVAISELIAMALGAWPGRARMHWLRLPLYVILIVVAAAIPTGLLVLYFTAKGAFWNMYYCVVVHNAVPGGKGIGRFLLHPWALPVALPFLVAYGFLILKQAGDTPLGVRRVLILLTPCIYYILLVAYWPNVSREDDLPYIPLLPFLPIPFLILVNHLWPNPRIERAFRSQALPVICLLELVLTWNTHNLRENRLRVLIDRVGDVLKLTNPGDYVMDTKSGYIFRERPYYWVLEPMTKTRLRLGLIKDDLPGRLEKTGTKVCELYTAYPGTPEAAFIVSNYLPIDPRAGDVGAAGKVIGNGSSGGTFQFNVAIPVRYAVVSETGELAGVLDGRTYAGPVLLTAGHHEFQRTSGSGRVAIILAEAVENGFRPQLDTSAVLNARLTKSKADPSD